MMVLMLLSLRWIAASNVLPITPAGNLFAVIFAVPSLRFTGRNGTTCKRTQIYGRYGAVMNACKARMSNYCRRKRQKIWF